MHIFDFVSALHTVFPPSTAMDGDSLGLLIQSGRKSIQRVLVCLDVTNAVIDEALRNNVDTILTFHPLIFTAMRSIHSDDRVGSCVEYAIQHNIAVVSAHTNVDAHPLGTNDAFATALGWYTESLLVPDQRVAGHGMGVLCRINPCSLDDILAKVRSVCGSPLRWCEGSSPVVNTVAIVCGSGSSFLPAAQKAGADVCITADVRYHTFHENVGRMSVVDPGHYEMEQFIPERLASLLRSMVLGAESNVEVLVSAVSTNPLRYT